MVQCTHCGLSSIDAKSDAPGERESALSCAKAGDHDGGYEVLTAGSILDAARTLPFLAKSAATTS